MSPRWRITSDDLSSRLSNRLCDPPARLASAIPDHAGNCRLRSDRGYPLNELVALDQSKFD